MHHWLVRWWWWWHHSKLQGVAWRCWTKWGISSSYCLPLVSCDNGFGTAVPDPRVKTWMKIRIKCCGISIHHLYTNSRVLEGILTMVIKIIIFNNYLVIGSSLKSHMDVLSDNHNRSQEWTSPNILWCGHTLVYFLFSVWAHTVYSYCHHWCWSDDGAVGNTTVCLLLLLCEVSRFTPVTCCGCLIIHPCVISGNYQSLGSCWKWLF